MKPRFVKAWGMYAQTCDGLEREKPAPTPQAIDGRIRRMAEG